MNTRAAGRGTTTAGIAATTDAVTTVAAAGERGRQGTRRGVIYQPGYTLTKSATFPEKGAALLRWRPNQSLRRRRGRRAHSRFPGHALTPTGVMAIRCKQFHLPDL